MGQPVTQFVAQVATVEILTYIGDLTQIISDPSEMIPHTFLKVVDVNGNIHYIGFAPQQTGLVGPGGIFDNFDHAVLNSSGAIQLSGQQGDRLKDYINGSIVTPPYYNLPEGNQCAVWALNGVLDAIAGEIVQSPIPPDATAPDPLGVLITVLGCVLN